MLTADWIVRGLLAGILACLLTLVLQLGSSQSPASGRYLVSGLGEPGGSLIRIDSLTGRSWKLAATASGEPRWEPLEERDGGLAAAPSRPVALSASSTVETAREAPAPLEVGRALLNEDLPSEVRIWAAYQLAGIPGDDAARLLVAALDDTDPPVVHAALEALAGRAGPRVRMALEGMRAHPDPYVSRRVGEILSGRS